MHQDEDAPITTKKITAWRLFVLGVIVVVWAAAGATVADKVLPSPWETLLAAVEISANGALAEALAQSLFVYLVGFALAAASAIPFGLAMGGIRLFGATMEVYVNALTATPRVAFIPLIIVFLGLDMTAKITIVWLGAIMPILVNTYAGVLNADRELIEMARSAGATRAQIFVKVMLPCASPYILAGLRLGAAIGLINTIVAELYTALTGLGSLLALYGNTFRMANYFVVVLTLAAVGAFMTQMLRYFEMRLRR